MRARGIFGGRRLLFFALIGLASSGCAIHPLPGDLAGVGTSVIVKQIRCEARAAGVQALLNYLADDDNFRNGQVDLASHTIGTDLLKRAKNDPEAVAKFDPRQLKGRAKHIVDILYSTGIAYNFDLTGLEMNNFDPQINFIRPLSISSVVSMGVSGSFDRSRQNERIFTITDTLGDLIANTKHPTCTRPVDENYIYPIAGRVGIDKVVNDFLNLTIFGNLVAENDKPKGTVNVKGPPTMVDQLQFVTKIGGTATPKIVFAPAGRAFEVGDASFGVTASRTDTHLLTVGIYLDQAAAQKLDAEPYLPHRQPVTRAAAVGVPHPGQFITYSGGPAERGAAVAVEQFLALKIFKPTIVVAQ